MGYERVKGADGPTGLEHRFAELGRATAGLQPPFAVVDLGAFDTNAAILRRNAIGKPLRLVSKSLRCRALMRRALAQPGFKGILGFTLPEALWLAEEFEDIVVAYPTADTDALRALAADDELARRITIMVDSVEHLDFLRRHVEPNPSRPLRLCLELDVSLELLGGRVHIGAHRSPVRSVEQALDMAHEIDKRPGVDLVGIMGYEGQIAGVRTPSPPPPSSTRWCGSCSGSRRPNWPNAAPRPSPPSAASPTWSSSTAAAPARRLHLRRPVGHRDRRRFGPVLARALRRLPVDPPDPGRVLRAAGRPAPRPGIVTALGGGWIASGVPGPDRLPKPTFPAGMRFSKTEGAGEVQTPLKGRAADGLAIGDRVWMRHAKAGELAERVNGIHLVQRGEVVDEVPTYRGEGRAFA